MIRLVSVSGGKDSTATLLLALERHPHDEIRGAFADTGNEHESTYEYVDYLERVTGVPIKRVKTDFSEYWPRRIKYVREKWPEKLRKGSWSAKASAYAKADNGKRIIVHPKPNYTPENIHTPHEEDHWKWNRAIFDDEADAIVSRALSILEKGPTGVPYLDLCMLKGRFPSRMAQFCTDELKVIPITEYTINLIDEFGAVESWQGVRAEESPRRAALPEREDKGGGVDDLSSNSQVDC
jgi:hypothetical protein